MPSGVILSVTASVFYVGDDLLSTNYRQPINAGIFTKSPNYHLICNAQKYKLSAYTQSRQQLIKSTLAKQVHIRMTHTWNERNYTKQICFAAIDGVADMFIKGYSWRYQT